MRIAGKLNLSLMRWMGRVDGWRDGEMERWRMGMLYAQ